MGIRLVAIQIGVWVGASYQRHRIAWAQHRAQQGSVDMVFLHVVLSAVLLDAQVKIFVPVKLRRHAHFAAEQIKRGRLFMNFQAEAVFYVVNFWLPIIHDDGFMIVAVVNKRFGLQRKRAGGAGEFVLDVGGVGSRLHPDALF